LRDRLTDPKSFSSRRQCARGCGVIGLDAGEKLGYGALVFGAMVTLPSKERRIENLLSVRLVAIAKRAVVTVERALGWMVHSIQDTRSRIAPRSPPRNSC